jgi:hypothetical protein
MWPGENPIKRFACCEPDRGAARILFGTKLLVWSLMSALKDLTANHNRRFTFP